MFFEDCKTIEELKAAYKAAALKNHPDMGGDVAVMQQINADFEKRFAQLKNGAFMADKLDDEVPEYFTEIIQDLVVIPGIEIEIVGKWIWVSGDTKPVKDQLKALGMRFSGKRKMWYKAPDEQGKHARSKGSMAEIREKYGSRSVASRMRPCIA